MQVKTIGDCEHLWLQTHNRMKASNTYPLNPMSAGLHLIHLRKSGPEIESYSSKNVNFWDV